jgi:hypothetical protein
VNDNFGSEFSIRRANIADADAIAQVHVAAWRETYAGLLPDAMIRRQSVETRRASWTRILGNAGEFPDSAVFVVQAEGPVAGFGSCGAQRAGELSDQGFEGEIRAIYVLDAFKEARRGHEADGRLGAGSLITRVQSGKPLGTEHEPGRAAVLRALGR